jgi:hypothetical protein
VLSVIGSPRVAWPGLSNGAVSGLESPSQTAQAPLVFGGGGSGGGGQLVTEVSGRFCCGPTAVDPGDGSLGTHVGRVGKELKLTLRIEVGLAITLT